MKNLKKLTILHSNDMHGDFLAEQIDENLVGGVSFLSGYVNQVRKQEKNVIYAIAGDMFRGSVIDSEYKGVSTIGIMNLLGPDVATIGNHEVDYGLSHLLFLEKCANFPIINANFHIRANWKRLFQPFYIAEMDGMKILFIGIITEDVLAQTKAEELIGSFVDIGEAAQEVGNICNAYNAIDIDFTVLLTHIGFEKDKKLATLLDPAWGVDVIIGGHSHTLLTEPALVNGIYIVQAGTGTDQIGRFDIMVDTDLNAIDTFTWQLVPINNITCQKDEEMEEFINHYRRETDKKYDRIVTRFTKCLTHPVRNQETALGNLIADILRDSLGIDLALMGSGAIRNYELGPVVHYQDLVECLPYDEAMYVDIEETPTGIRLKKYMEEYFDPRIYIAGELGIGLNSCSNCLGNCYIEDESAYGTFHVGLGRNIALGGVQNAKGHFDLVCREPDIFTDNRQIMDRGKIIAPEPVLY